MSTPDTTDPVPVDLDRAAPEIPGEPPLAGTETEAPLGALDRVLGDGGRVREDPPGRLPVSGDSAVWNG